MAINGEYKKCTSINNDKDDNDDNDDDDDVVVDNYDDVVVDDDDNGNHDDDYDDDITTLSRCLYLETLVKVIFAHTLLAIWSLICSIFSEGPIHLTSNR